ncbi:sensor histidine kinase [Bradyrhizobium erythrophlei]|uniref:histidine kinase n=1 Tax=Bradyrhizobium erythrophlei TaxID=1437360 RepID=A0A1M5PV56_9BRAD|nr:PAS domain-containing sensor histidine kinase [Bradyrhizobium erythrophlei]SHH05562.1 His Kinase A (phospho-acceptor) domain-containing protein [Bradyrhizobium erythrophlei]
MTELAEGPTHVAVRRSLGYWNQEFQRIHSPILRYGFSVVSVGMALGVGFALQHYQFRDVELPVLTLAIAFTTWYAGAGPSVLAVLLSSAFFDYFFIEPLYSFDISSRDLPYFFIFVAWAVIVASFSAVRRRIEDNLRQARDHLQVEVVQRRQREDEIRKLNLELGKRALELEASNKELESFAYSVSHDLRAPLRHMVGYSELLQRQASSLLDEKSQRFIRTILDSAKRMGNLIDDLLSFSRIGRAETKKTQVDLGQLVQEVVAEIKQDTKGRDIAWKVGALPVCYGDRSMLRLVVVNLVSNAAKFTRLRRPAEIEIGCVDRNKKEVEVFVRDNGAGFDMQYVNKLFGVFQRLHLPEQFEGTGIGLATVQRIIHRHGGEVRGEGAVDQGATFYFSLTKAQDAAERTANAP